MANLLIIDDDDTMRGLLARALRDAHSVREARNGREALRLLKEEPADVIVSDVYMPEMDGMEVLMRLRQSHRTARVIILTGGGNMDAGSLLEIATSLGAKRTLFKPVSIHDLRAAVDEVLAET